MHPASQLVYSFVEISNPKGERFERIVREFPFIRNLVLEETLHNFLEFFTDKN